MTARTAPTHPDPLAVVLRPACSADGAELARLAELDSAGALHGAILVAEHDGVIAAALELRSGRVIADPFRPTADLVTLLRARASLLRGAAQHRRALRVRRPTTVLRLPA